MRYTPFEKQSAIINTVELFYQRVIDSQLDNGDGTVTFTTTENHNYIADDHITIYNEMDDDNVITDYNDYNPSSSPEHYKVISVTDDTFTVTATYNANADLSNAKCTSVLVYNNDQMENNPSLRKYPLLVVDMLDDLLLKNNANLLIVVETLFRLTFLDAKNHHTKGDNTRILLTRTYVHNKFTEIWNELKMKPYANDNKSGRGEIIWGDVESSYKDGTLVF